MLTVSIAVGVEYRRYPILQTDHRAPRIVEPSPDSSGFRRLGRQYDLSCASRRLQSHRLVSALNFQISSSPPQGSISAYRRDRQPCARSSGFCQKRRYYASVTCENFGGVRIECWRSRTSQIPHELQRAISRRWDYSFLGPSSSAFEHAACPATIDTAIIKTQGDLGPGLGNSFFFSLVTREKRCLGCEQLRVSPQIEVRQRTEFH